MRANQFLLFVRSINGTAEPGEADALRLEFGNPRWGQDYDERTLPPELGEAFAARHVSYAKGCYVGQEVMMRIHARGHTNRTWVGLLASGSVTAGSAIRSASREKAGKVTSVARSPEFGVLGAGFVHRDDALDGTEVWIDGFRADVRPFPLRR